MQKSTQHLRVIAGRPTNAAPQTPSRGLKPGEVSASALKPSAVAAPMRRWDDQGPNLFALFFCGVLALALVMSAAIIVFSLQRVAP
jgi:hypothetical protein